MTGLPTPQPWFPLITSGEQRNSKATCLQIGSQEYHINHHPNTKNTANNLLSLLDAKALWQPGQSFILAGFILSLPGPDPCGSEQPIQRERPVATQHPLRNCVWSSSSSFPHICNTTSWNWTVTKLHSMFVHFLAFFLTFLSSCRFDRQWTDCIMEAVLICNVRVFETIGWRVRPRPTVSWLRQNLRDRDSQKWVWRLVSRPDQVTKHHRWWLDSIHDSINVIISNVCFWSYIWISYVIFLIYTKPKII